MPGEADRHDVEIGVKSDDRPFAAVIVFVFTAR